MPDPFLPYLTPFYLHEKQKDRKKTKELQNKHTPIFNIFHSSSTTFLPGQPCVKFWTKPYKKEFHEKNTGKEHFYHASLPALQSQPQLRDSPGEATQPSAVWLLNCLLPGGVSWLPHLCKKPGDSKVNFKESTSYPNQTGFLVTMSPLNWLGERLQPFNPFFVPLSYHIFHIFHHFWAIFVPVISTGKLFKTQWDFNSM